MVTIKENKFFSVILDDCFIVRDKRTGHDVGYWRSERRALGQYETLSEASGLGADAPNLRSSKVTIYPRPASA